MPGDLTFSARLSTLLFVEPEIDCPASGGDDDPSTGYVRRAQAGDADGYKQLFRLHVRRLHRLVYRLAGPGCDVEDLVQTVFVQAFAALPGFRGDSSFFTWLGRIAIRITLRLSKQSRYRPLPVDEGQDAAVGISPEGASDARRALARFDAILASLSEKRRAAFVLHVLQGHSLEEVAALLDAKVGAIKVRVHDARVEIERQARQDPYLARYLQWETRP
ncbi:MAG TPA: RNA polymerase sigma factor [Polyangia bacterium]